MRVLLSAVGTRGDVQPLVVLGLALQRAGHQVVVCAALDFGDWVRTFGLEHHPINVNTGEAIARAGNSAGKVLAMIREAVSAEFDAVRAAPGRFDLMLGSGMASAGASVGEATGVPHRQCVFCPEMLPSRTHPSPVMRWQGLPQWLNRLSWTLYDQIWDAAALKVINRNRAELGLTKLRTSWLHVQGRAPLIAADPWLAPTPSDAPVTTASTGAWLMPPGPALSGELEQFLAGGPPPVYFGFGSMLEQAPARTVELLVEVARRLGVRALIPSALASPAPLPDSVHPYGPVDHARLFPRCAAIVHHGGAGTTTAAAAAGVPQVVVPHLGDQFWWAHRIHGLGLGPPGLPRARLSVERLEQALKTALGDGHVSAAREGATRISHRGLELAVKELRGAEAAATQ